MNTQRWIIGGALVALGWWLYNQTTMGAQVKGTVLPSRQLVPNFGPLAIGQQSSLGRPARMTDALLPGGMLSGDFGYLPNVGPLNADLIAAALDANTVTDLPSNIVNPAIDPWALEQTDEGDMMLNGDVLPSYTIVDPGWSGLI